MIKIPATQCRACGCDLTEGNKYKWQNCCKDCGKNASLMFYFKTNVGKKGIEWGAKTIERDVEILAMKREVLQKIKEGEQNVRQEK